MRLLLENCTVIDLDPPGVRHAAIRIEDDRILDVGALSPAEGEETFDCSDFVVMPGLVVGHTHLYSSLAVGMPPPKNAPRDFVEILKEVWWKLDCALDDEGTYMSALVGASRAALAGATTLIDHHASPRAIAGSLDLVARGMEDVGLRGILCYEVTDRHGSEGARAGIAENKRFIEACRKPGFAGLMGAHASFTIEESTLRELTGAATELGTGVHIHCAEDAADVEDCAQRYGCDLIKRFVRAGMPMRGTLLAHGTQLTPEQIVRATDAGASIAHNPRSNMNNAVGYARTDAMPIGSTMIGTDGIDNDMFAESRTAWFKARDAHSSVQISSCLQWLANNARFASAQLGTRLGVVEPGAAADLVLLDYRPVTPLETSNLLGHWFYALGAQHVHSVIARGKWIVWDRQYANPSIPVALSHAPDVARNVWARL